MDDQDPHDTGDYINCHFAIGIGLIFTLAALGIEGLRLIWALIKHWGIANIPSM